MASQAASARSETSGARGADCDDETKADALADLVWGHFERNLYWSNMRWTMSADGLSRPLLLAKAPPHSGVGSKEGCIVTVGAHEDLSVARVWSTVAGLADEQEARLAVVDDDSTLIVHKVHNGFRATLPDPRLLSESDRPPPSTRSNSNKKSKKKNKEMTHAH
uniref:Uncharacterized protein n=1 Tax=Lotharella oceanica TaxID=641309 RepID=A0A7S2TLM3_9EUKA|mmetsp:Transcript_19994/g.37559  ORF Transcript_19994/g.37559 Transcript_19994/m.37559 type:complete len:164 (+) Transcript_19994:2-493(+)